MLIRAVSMNSEIHWLAAAEADRSTASAKI